MAQVALPHVFAIAKSGGRKGPRTLWYFRRRGYRDPVSGKATTALPGRPGEPDFTAAYQAALADSECQRTAARPAPRARPGTLGALIDAFRGGTWSAPSVEWQRLAPRTRKDWSRHLDRLQASFGHLALTGLAPEHGQPWKGRIWVMQLRARHMATPRQADMLLQVLRRLFNFAIDQGQMSDNPAARPGRLYSHRRDQVWSWQDEQAFLAAIDAADTRITPAERRALRLYYLLLAYTGQRPGDVRAMRWDQIAARPLDHGAALDETGIAPSIEVTQQKTGKRLWIRLHHRLVDELARARQASHGLTVVQTARGRPFAERNLARAWATAMAAAGLAGRGLQARDLRRTAVVRLAEAGVPVSHIAAITGHEIDRSSAIIDKTYMPKSALMASQGIVRLEDYMRRREGGDDA